MEEDNDCASSPERDQPDELLRDLFKHQLPMAPDSQPESEADQEGNPAADLAQSLLNRELPPSVHDLECRLKRAEQVRHHWKWEESKRRSLLNGARRERIELDQLRRQSPHGIHFSRSIRLLTTEIARLETDHAEAVLELALHNAKVEDLQEQVVQARADQTPLWTTADGVVEPPRAAKYKPRWNISEERIQEVMREYGLTREEAIGAIHWGV